jgi:hypothetical protein
MLNLWRKSGTGGPPTHSNTGPQLELLEDRSHPSVRLGTGIAGAAYRKKKWVLPTVELLEDRTVPSVTVGVSVDGMNTSDNFCNCQPPDTIAAAGPYHVVEMVNTAIEVFSKSGTVTSAPESLATFFNPTNPNQSDPFVFYDELAGQFVAGVLDYSSGSAADLVDFATGTDGTGGISWTVHTPIPSAEGSNFLDYPRVGYNADAYFIEGNMFAGNTFRNIQIITIDKSGGVLSRHDDASLFTATPAAMHGAAAGGPEYFVESANGGGSTLQIVTETNVTSGTPTFTTTSVSVPSYVGGGPAPQGVASFDDRIFDAADRTVSGVNHLVAAHQVGSSHRNSAPVARWYDINTATMSLIQEGNAPAGVRGAATFMPTVDINTAGSIGMTFGESAKREFWSMYITERTASDASGTMEAPVLVAAGVARSSDSRVGDFSSTTVDPSDGLTFWSANEYQGSDFWDTHIASFSIAGAVPSPTLPVLLADSGGQQSENPTVTTGKAGSAGHENGMVSQATPLPPTPLPGTQTVNGVRVPARLALDRFWIDAVSYDFLASGW